MQRSSLLTSRILPVLCYIVLETRADRHRHDFLGPCHELSIPSSLSHDSIRRRNAATRLRCNIPSYEISQRMESRSLGAVDRLSSCGHYGSGARALQRAGSEGMSYLWEDGQVPIGHGGRHSEEYAWERIAKNCAVRVHPTLTSRVVIHVAPNHTAGTSLMSGACLTATAAMKSATNTNCLGPDWQWGTKRSVP